MLALSQLAYFCLKTQLMESLLMLLISTSRSVLVTLLPAFCSPLEKSAENVGLSVHLTQV